VPRKDGLQQIADNGLVLYDQDLFERHGGEGPERSLSQETNQAKSPTRFN
jgi:hypothetical protein